MSLLLSFCTGNGNLGAVIEFDPTNLSAPQIRSLLERLCNTLVLRGEFLPQSITFQPRQPPTLLNLPREIRDRIYEFSCPGYLEKMHARGRSRGYTIRVQSMQALEPPAKKRRTASKAISGPFEESTSFMPTVWIKFNGPTRFHELRKICSQMHSELVTEVFAENSVGVKIDLTNVTSIANDDFLERAFPGAILKAVHELNIEVHVSVAIWKDLCASLCEKLSKLSVKSQCILRAFVASPKEKTNRYVLERFHGSRDIAHELQQKTAFLKGMAQEMSNGSMRLTKLPRLHQIQLLFAPLRNWSETMRPYPSWMVEFAAVQKHFGNEWMSSEGGITSVLGMDPFLRVIDHDVIDL